MNKESIPNPTGVPSDSDLRLYVQYLRHAKEGADRDGDMILSETCYHAANAIESLMAKCSAQSALLKAADKIREVFWNCDAYCDPKNPCSDCEARIEYDQLKNLLTNSIRE